MPHDELFRQFFLVLILLSPLNNADCKKKKDASGAVTEKNLIHDHPPETANILMQQEIRNAVKRKGATQKNYSVPNRPSGPQCHAM